MRRQEGCKLHIGMGTAQAHLRSSPRLCKTRCQHSGGTSQRSPPATGTHRWLHTGQNNRLSQLLVHPHFETCPAGKCLRQQQLVKLNDFKPILIRVEKNAFNFLDNVFSCSNTAVKDASDIHCRIREQQKGLARHCGL